MEVNKFIVLVALILTGSNVLRLQALPISSSFSISEEIYIISQQDKGEHNHFGNVKGVRSCGGHGQVIQLWHEPCSKTDSELCQIPGDGETRRFELEFIPSRDVTALGFQFLVINNGHITTAFERQIGNSAVLGGEKYSVNAMVGANPQFKNGTISIQYMIFRIEDDNLEACAEADFDVI